MRTYLNVIDRNTGIRVYEQREIEQDPSILTAQMYVEFIKQGHKVNLQIVLGGYEIYADRFVYSLKYQPEVAMVMA